MPERSMFIYNIDSNKLLNQILKVDREVREQRKGTNSEGKERNELERPWY